MSRVRCEWLENRDTKHSDRYLQNQGPEINRDFKMNEPPTPLIYVDEKEFKTILEKSIRPKYREKKYSISSKKSMPMNECFKRAWDEFVEEKSKVLPKYYIPEPPSFIPPPPPLPPFLLFTENNENYPKPQIERKEEKTEVREERGGGNRKRKPKNRNNRNRGNNNRNRNKQSNK